MSEVPSASPIPGGGAAPLAQPPYGIAPYVDRAVSRIERYFRDGSDGEAFVVGVFGEWGSGKSTVLRAIGERFNPPPLPPPPPAAPNPADLVDRGKGWLSRLFIGETPAPSPPPASVEPSLTLRVEFNAWRYEREEHLLVPLLKTIQRVLDARVAALDSPAGPVRDWRWLADRAQLLGACAIALTRVVKVKAGLPGFGEVELNPAEALKAAQEQIDRVDKLNAASATPKAASARPLESLYYDLNAELLRITRGSGTPDQPALNLVILVDDLDRCLPEKAVEMLEAIKLFLDVQGCAFVLALDDEVIERGIAYRYRDYLKSPTGVDSAQPVAPITGHEYLEKIVQLPFRLPRWSKREVRDFLQTRHAQRLALWAGMPSDTLDQAALSTSAPNGWLVDLLVDAVPPVPRNLVRSLELLDFIREVALKRNLGQRLQAYPVAQLVLLQLFAPQAFRFLRRGHAEGWKTFERRLRDERQEFITGLSSEIDQQLAARPDRLAEEFFDWWIELSKRRIAHEKPSNPYWSRTELPLARQLGEACNNRNGFDPRNLFLLGRDEVQVDEELDPYFSLFEEVPAGLASPVVAMPPPAVAPVVPVSPMAAPIDPVAPGRTAPAVQVEPPAQAPAGSAPVTPAVPARVVPRDRQAFVRQLLSRSADAWRNAISREEQLKGQRLDERSFELLLNEIGESPREAAWLEVVLPLLDDGQVRQLVRRTGSLARLARQAGLLDEPAPGARA